MSVFVNRRRLTKCYRSISMKSVRFIRLRFVPGVLLFVLLASAFPLASRAQEENNYDEVSVSLNIARLGSFELPTVVKNEEVYLSVKDLFDIVKIKSTASADFSSVAGFFIHPKAAFLIDKKTNRIEYEEKITDVKQTDIIQTSSGLYLKAPLFKQVFDLDCAFDFRNLAVTLSTQAELPALREMQQEVMYKNIRQLRGEKKADTVVPNSRSFFHLGVADWSFTTMQETKGVGSIRANFGVGAVVAGGDLEANVNYYSDHAWDNRQQYLRWHYVDNDFSALRQITLGRVYTPSVSTLFAPLNGVQLTNTPTTHRKSYGTYRLNSTTEPNWRVELYVNNVLVNYTKADASGFFSFEVPIIYGNSAVKLRFYGPWGEERMQEQNITVPFDFLPQNEFEYTLTAGIVEDEEKSRFSRLHLKYGLNQRITVGAGAEYLSSATNGKPMPFVNTSLRLGSGLLFSAEHTAGVRSKGTFNYRLPSNVQVDLNYTTYVKGQTAFKFNYLEERKASLSMPYTGKSFAVFSRFTYNRITVPKLKYTNLELLLSAMFRGVSANITTMASYSTPAYPYVYSNASFSFRLPKGIRFTQQFQYDYTQKNIGFAKGELEKRLSNLGFLNVSYEKNLKLNTSYAGIGLRLNFSFAQTAFSVLQGNGKTSTTQSARGSLLYNDRAKKISANNQTNVGRGGVVVCTFLDINGNGKRDANEPKIAGVKLRVNGGIVENSEADTTVRIVGLEAYNNYLIEFDKSSFDNIAWQLRKATYGITTEPNYFRYLDVPVAVLAEASGTVTLQNEKEQQGIGRITVTIFDSTRPVARTLTEADGYFTYLGLTPGVYTAKIDTAQLRKLNLRSTPESIRFTVVQSKEGAVVDNLAFTLQPLAKPAEEPEESKLPAVETRPVEENKKQETKHENAVKKPSPKPKRN